MSSNLENEDLAGVQLVRMEDIQPRDRSSESSSSSGVKKERENADYGDDCIVDDDDSNIGSMVSIESESTCDEVLVPPEEVSVPCEISCESMQPEGDTSQMDSDDSSSEMIIPEVVNTEKVMINVAQIPKKEIKPAPQSWPTLEILPGGVIRRSEYTEKTLKVEKECKVEKQSPSSVPKQEAEGNDSDAETSEKMYACAKCSRSFKYLYCLVKHVRWHEKQQKFQQSDQATLCKCEDCKLFCVHPHGPKGTTGTKVNKKVPKRSIS